MQVGEEKKLYRTKIKQSLFEYRQEKTLCIQEEQEACKLLLSSQHYTEASAILAYAASEKEFSLDFFIQEALKQEKKLFLPRSHTQELSLDFFQLENKIDLDSQLIRGAYGIREPLPCLPRLEIESLPERTLILIPGLGFTRGGKRLGKGKGYYDRFLSRLLCKGTIREGLILMGVCHSCQILDDLPTEKNDILVDYLLTPSQILSCFS